MLMRACFVLLGISLIVLQGCAAINSFSIAARQGDTITLALGSQDYMTKANTTVMFTPDSTGVPINFTPYVKSIFKLRADQGSRVYNVVSYTYQLGIGLKHEPWLTVMALDIPTDQGLTPGWGTFNISTTGQQNVSIWHPEISVVNIRFEVLPGVGVTHPLNYVWGNNGVYTAAGTYSGLETESQFVIRPPNVDWGNYGFFGAAEMKLQLPMTIPGRPEEDTWLRVVETDVQVVTRSRRNITWSINGSEMTILFVSVTGRLDPWDTRISIVRQIQSQFPATGVAITSLRFFDIDGNEVSGPEITDYTVSLEGI